MPMELPPAILAIVEPIFAALPLTQAMGGLVVSEAQPAEVQALVGRAVTEAEVARRPGLAAGLWLYVDNLHASHVISQGMNDATGALWHGIMHRREGDFSNSHHWFRKAGDHPALRLIEGLDPHALIDRVESAHRVGESPAALIEQQRREWAVVFGWCAR